MKVNVKLWDRYMRHTVVMDAWFLHSIGGMPGIDFERIYTNTALVMKKQSYADTIRMPKKCSSAGKTGFGEKSSPERGESGASWGLLLVFLSHIGTRKCSKFVV